MPFKNSISAAALTYEGEVEAPGERLGEVVVPAPALQLLLHQPWPHLQRVPRFSRAHLRTELWFSQGAA
jgi:hypothetical protein